MRSIMNALSVKATFGTLKFHLMTMKYPRTCYLWNVLFVGHTQRRHVLPTALDILRKAPTLLDRPNLS
jgi:hypothetical protein